MHTVDELGIEHTTQQLRRSKRLMGTTVVVATLGLMTLMGMGFIGSGPSLTVHAQPSIQPTHTQAPRIVPTPEVLRARDMGTWRYVVSRGRDDLGRTYVAASIHHDTSSVATLQAFAAVNRVLAAQLATTSGQVEVLVTFRSYVSPEQYRTWVAQRGLAVDTTDLRVLEASGRRAGLGVTARPDDVLPESSLHGSSPDNSTIVGVNGARGTIPTNRLLELASDPLVFIPDVTPAIVRQEMVGIVSDPNQIYMSLEGQFWQMEDFGLENFR